MEVRDSIFNAIERERERQDAKFANQSHRTDEEWYIILAEEFGEIAPELMDKEETRMVTEIIQTAAVCVAWLEYRAERKAKGVVSPPDNAPAHD